MSPFRNGTHLTQLFALIRNHRNTKLNNSICEIEQLVNRNLSVIIGYAFYFTATLLTRRKVAHCVWLLGKLQQVIVKWRWVTSEEHVLAMQCRGLERGARDLPHFCCALTRQNNLIASTALQMMPIKMACNYLPVHVCTYLLTYLVALLLLCN